MDHHFPYDNKVCAPFSIKQPVTPTVYHTLNDTRILNAPP